MLLSRGDSKMCHAVGELAAMIEESEQAQKKAREARAWKKRGRTGRPDVVTRPSLGAFAAELERRELVDDLQALAAQDAAELRQCRRQAQADARSI